MFPQKLELEKNALSLASSSSSRNKELEDRVLKERKRRKKRIFFLEKCNQAINAVNFAHCHAQNSTEAIHTFFIKNCVLSNGDESIVK